MIYGKSDGTRRACGCSTLREMRTESSVWPDSPKPSSERMSWRTRAPTRKPGHEPLVIVSVSFRGRSEATEPGRSPQEATGYRCQACIDDLLRIVRLDLGRHVPESSGPVDSTVQRGITRGLRRICARAALDQRHRN